MDSSTKTAIEALCAQLWERGALEMENLDLKSLYQTAYTLYQLGRYEQAQVVFSRLVMASPYTISHWQGLGASYQLQKHYKEALVCWSIYALIAPKSPEPHYYAAQCYKALNNSDEAKSALNAAKRLVRHATPELQRQMEVFAL